MKKRIIAPPSICRVAIVDAICERSNDLVQQMNGGQITFQEYLARQFPSDAITFLEDAISAEVSKYINEMQSVMEQENAH